MVNLCSPTGFGIRSRLVQERQADEPPEMIAGTLVCMAPEQTGRMTCGLAANESIFRPRMPL
jgi:hypothetical protein